MTGITGMNPPLTGMRAEVKKNRWPKQCWSVLHKVPIFVVEGDQCLNWGKWKKNNYKVPGIPRIRVKDTLDVAPKPFSHSYMFLLIDSNPFKYLLLLLFYFLYCLYPIYFPFFICPWVASWCQDSSQEDLAFWITSAAQEHEASKRSRKVTVS